MSIESFAPLAAGSGVSDVAQSLIEVISSDQTPRGSKLPAERQLAAALKVGRSVVREALAVLDPLGLVTIRHGSGTYVRATSSTLLSGTVDWGLVLNQPRTLDLVELRQDLECASARHAAHRAAPEDLEELARCIRSMRENLHDPQAFVEADVEFHMRVAGATRNSVIVDLLSSVRSLLQVWISRAVNEESDLTGTLEEHEKIFAAISRNDSDAAHAAMSAHMDAASHRLRQSLHGA